ncbi:MAG: transglycosylase SLT domain-containing protein [Salinisphaera sp.]|nr:transglycosylase SLT domain-containing protein [Salinisphaera sp.]
MVVVLSLCQALNRRPRWRYLLWLLVCVAALADAQNRPPVQPVPPAYRSAANTHGVPPAMLYALSLTESAAPLAYGRRPWPWTLDIDGRGVRYVSRAAACSALHAALNRTPIVDVGLGQLNVHWQQGLFGPGGRFARPCAALDPYANLDAAAAVLARCHLHHSGSWIAAAGCYHHPAGGAPAARYRRAFKVQLRQVDAGVRLATDEHSSTGASTPPHGAMASAAGARSHTTHVRAQQVTWINPQAEDPHGLD